MDENSHLDSSHSKSPFTSGFWQQQITLEELIQRAGIKGILHPRASDVA